MRFLTAGEKNREEKDINENETYMKKDFVLFVYVVIIENRGILFFYDFYMSSLAFDSFTFFYIKICHKFKIFIARATENEFFTFLGAGQ
jgi:hypothetical protein